MPPLSSYFNPIETIWAWVKQKWRQELIQLLGAQPTRKYMIQTLTKICEEAPSPVVTNIARSCIKLMYRYFDKYSMQGDPNQVA